MTTLPVRLEWQRSYDVGEIGRLHPVRAKDAPVRLISGDNLASLQCLGPELASQVRLAYLDPPFLTGKSHDLITRKRNRFSGEIQRSNTLAFDDRFDGLAGYLDFMAPRLMAMFECLSADGSFVLHVDTKTSHYLKVLCDELFGAQHFASEIIWRYRRWPAKTKNFQRMHDVLLRYTKCLPGEAHFGQLYEPQAPSTLQTWGKGKQRAIVDGSGRRRRSSTTHEPSPGAPLGDVWELGIVAPVARERTGYPTQKPEALIERLIEALSSPGDLVLDPFTGSGTTLVCAARLGRRAVGIDRSAQAISVTCERLAALGVEFARQAHVSRRGQRLAS